ncbi:MAG: hypothetical protein CMA11_06365 [Euryarchaeota archaeon]|nr:hypothetical protein [Euryarchaeota archaeon]
MVIKTKAEPTEQVSDELAPLDLPPPPNDERLDEVIEGIGLRRPRSAVLWSCANCTYWNVTIHNNTTITENVKRGSSKVKLCASECCGCGQKRARLNSAASSRIVACVDASKPKQVRNLRATAEELNCLQEAGEQATEHDANTAWFAMNRLLKQGKGRKYWAMPFRRWEKVQSTGAF